MLDSSSCFKNRFSFLPIVELTCDCSRFWSTIGFLVFSGSMCALTCKRRFHLQLFSEHLLHFPFRALPTVSRLLYYAFNMDVISTALIIEVSCFLELLRAKCLELIVISSTADCKFVSSKLICVLWFSISFRLNSRFALRSAAFFTHKIVDALS